MPLPQMHMHKKSRGGWWLPLLCFLPLWVCGQTASWTVYQTANSGLPDNSVFAIAVGPQGRKWIGTDFGLALFNDTTWTVFRSATSGLPDNSVRAVLAGTSGEVWVGTLAGGLARYDGSTWTRYQPANSGLPDLQVRALALDPQGRLYAGTTAGLARFDGSSWRVWNTANSALLSDNISALAVAADGAVCIGTVNGGFAYLRHDSLTVYTHANSLLPDNTILAAALDSAGRAWLATPAAGLVLHQPDTLFTVYNPATSSNPSYSLTAVALGPQAYLGSRDAGLVTFSGSRWQHYTTANSPLPHDFVQALALEPDGTLWAGTSAGGVVRIAAGVLSRPESGTQPAAAYALYPNPIAAGGLLRVTGLQAGVQVQVFSVQGRQLAPVQLVSAEWLQLPRLAPGLYLLQFSTAEGVQVHKLLVQ